MKKLNRENIIRIICSTLLLISIISFFFTGAIYKEESIELSLFSIAFGRGVQNISIILTLAFIGLVICFMSSAIGFFIESTIAKQLVIYLGLVFGISLFFTLGVASPNLSGFQIGFAPILGGITAILGSLITFINEKIDKKQE